MNNIKNNNTVGERVKYLRGQLGMSQTKFAHVLRLANNYVSAIENGRRKPGVALCNAMIEIALANGIKIDIPYLRPDLYA